MIVRISAPCALLQAARAHLNLGEERVGFFLADWSARDRVFRIRSWRAVEHDAANRPGALHVSLSDDLRAEIIHWAWGEDACLIEAHSHGRWEPAEFSSFDLHNLEEWVPHLWWRLRGRPYAALVTSTSDFDALAWIDSPRHVEQVEGIEADHFVPATRATLSGLKMRSERGREPL